MKLKLRCGTVISVDDDVKEQIKKFLGVSTFVFPVKFSIHKRHGYVMITYGKDRFALHKAVMNYYGTLVVDHIDGNRLNNKKENLRLCSYSDNSKNKRMSKNNTSGFKGVGLSKTGKYHAKITSDGKKIHVGTYDTPEEAALAYDEAACKYHGEFAKTNKGMGLI